MKNLDVLVELDKCEASKACVQACPGGALELSQYM